MPELLTNVLAEHTYDPVSLGQTYQDHLLTDRAKIPISTSVRKCASNFKKTYVPYLVSYGLLYIPLFIRHQDTWHEDSKRFDDDQLAALSTLLTGSSYCESLAFLFAYHLSTQVQTHNYDPEATAISLSLQSIDLL